MHSIGEPMIREFKISDPRFNILYYLRLACPRNKLYDARTHASYICFGTHVSETTAATTCSKVRKEDKYAGAPMDLLIMRVLWSISLRADACSGTLRVWLKQREVDAAHCSHIITTVMSIIGA